MKNMQQYHEGDRVRIKSITEIRMTESRTHKVQNGSAIDFWQNRLCTITHVVPTIGGFRYKLSLCGEEDSVCNGVHIYEYLWEEWELELNDEIPGDVSEDIYAQLIGGGLQ